jgi:hypothetical protein
MPDEPPFATARLAADTHIVSVVGGLGSMLPHIEYSVTARTSPEQLWEAFCDLSRLLNRGTYTDATWIEGQPWQVGSRVRYTLEKPVAAVILSVITAVDPPRRISLINHSLGITADQIVTFYAFPSGTTRVSMVIEFVGESNQLTPQAVVDAIDFLTKDALDSMIARWQQKTQP